jgi:hypothetical protein
MSNWINEGFFIRLSTPEFETKEFYFVEQTEMARYKFKWPESVASNSEDGPRNVEDLKPLATNRLYQGIFGIKTACYIYLNLPLNTRLWGTDKKPIATSSLREVGYRDHNETPFEQPSFITEFFLMKNGSFDYPAFLAYNPTERSLTPELNIIMNKMIIEKVTDVETLEKLKKKLIPYRPVTLGGLSSVRTGAKTS